MKLITLIGRQLRKRIGERRSPDFVLAKGDHVYMKRWYVLPRSKVFCLYLHKFEGSDEDRALHDHPAINISFLLDGFYLEHTPDGVIERKQGQLIIRRAKALHRIELHKGSCWTLFIFFPKYRNWGFACEQGWIPWQQFEHQNGCGEP